MGQGLKAVKVYVYVWFQAVKCRENSFKSNKRIFIPSPVFELLGQRIFCLNMSHGVLHNLLQRVF